MKPLYVAWKPLRARSLVLNSQDGFSLIELMVAGTLLAGLLLGVGEGLNLFVTSTQNISSRDIRDSLAAAVKRSSLNSLVASPLAPVGWSGTSSFQQNCLVYTPNATYNCPVFANLDYNLAIPNQTNQAVQYIAGPLTAATPIYYNRNGVKLTSATNADYQVWVQMTGTCQNSVAGGNCPLGYELIGLSGWVITGSSTVPSTNVPNGTAILATTALPKLPFGDLSFQTYIVTMSTVSTGSGAGSSGAPTATATHYQVLNGTTAANSSGANPNFPGTPFTWDVFPNCDATPGGCFVGRNSGGGGP